MNARMGVVRNNDSSSINAGGGRFKASMKARVIGKNPVSVTIIIFGNNPNPSHNNKNGINRKLGIVCITTRTGRKNRSNRGKNV